MYFLQLNFIYLYLAEKTETQKEEETTEPKEEA